MNTEIRERTLRQRMSSLLNRQLRPLCLLAACFIAASGCQSSTDGDDHEIEHTRPDHWPNTFIELTDQLAARFDEIDTTASVQSPDDELLDLLKWLPEIAGDTSLDEADWTAAVASGEELASILKTGGDSQSPISKLKSLAAKTREDMPPFVPGRPPVTAKPGYEDSETDEPELPQESTEPPLEESAAPSSESSSESGSSELTEEGE